MTSPLAQAALLLHVPLTIVLFATMRPVRATALAILTAVLFLPELVEFDPPLLPPFNKYSLSALSVSIGIAVSSLPPTKRVSKVLITSSLLLLIGGIGTVFGNMDALRAAPGLVLPGMVAKDLISVVVWDVLSILLPFYIGRRVFRSPDDVAELLGLVVMFAMGYMFLMLIELRLSPQLHNWIYGYHQHQFGQSVRDGGFRPVVFMAHGLAVVMYVLAAILAAMALHRAQLTIWGVKPRNFALFMLLVLLFCNSFGVVFYVLIALPILWFGGARSVTRLAFVVTVLVVAFPLLRAANLVPIDAIFEFFQGLNPERAESLNYRFNNEELALAKWSFRPLFGWGGYGRNLIYDEYAKANILDGDWIIMLSGRGLVGFFGKFLLLVAPLWMARRYMRRVVDPTGRLLLGGLIAIVATSVVDLVPNGMFNYLPLFFSGVLAGHCEWLSQAPVSGQQAGISQAGVSQAGVCQAGVSQAGVSQSELRTSVPPS